MADLRDTQHPIEVIEGTAGDLRDTQNPVELVVNAAGDLRDTQNPVELIVRTAGDLRDTQNPIEVVLSFNVARLSETGEFVDLALDERGRFVLGRTADPQSGLRLEDGRFVFEIPIIPPGPPPTPSVAAADTLDLSDTTQSQLTKRIGDQPDIVDASASQLTKRVDADQFDITETVSTQIVQPTVATAPAGLFSGVFGAAYLGRFGTPPAAAAVLRLVSISDALDVSDDYRRLLGKRLDDSSGLSDGSANQLTKRTTDQVGFADNQQKTLAKSVGDRLELTDSLIKSLTLRFNEREDVADSVLTLKQKSANGSDTQEIVDSIRRILVKGIVDTLESNDGFNKLLTKRISGDQVDLTDSANIQAVRASRTQTASDNLQISDSIKRIIVKGINDTLDSNDGLNKLLTKRIGDRLDLTDSANVQAFRAGSVTQTASDRVDIRDSYVSVLLKHIDGTDMETFTDQVMLQLLTRELRFFDQVMLIDSSDEIVITFAQSLQALMAGIRTFTCTPGYAIQREAITMTSVVDFDNAGLYGTFGRSSRPAYRFRVPILALTKVQVDSLNAFHMFHQGGKPFYWDGGRYGYIGTPQLIGEGDSSRKDFYLANRNIDPNSIQVAILHGATSSITTAYSLYATAGMISLTTAPNSGDDVMAAHAHKYLVKFEPEGLRTEEIFSGIFRAELILRETIL